MPQKNCLKIYIENGYYHIYNRGVNKRIIFKGDQDYAVFLSYLKDALSPQPPQNQLNKIPVNILGQTFLKAPRITKNFEKNIELLAYCLMPNHFHLLIKQIVNQQMEFMMRSLTTRYSMYFNKKYHRVGHLFQGRYKAVLVGNDNYIMHLSRYVHLNPSKHFTDLTQAYSSYANYLGTKKQDWVKPDFILKMFNQPTLIEFNKIYTYKYFMEHSNEDSKRILGSRALE